MDIKTLEELQAADERTLAFTPLGLGRMAPEDAADFQQRVIADLQLAGEVTEATRNKFEQLRAAHAHGVLCYELFTLVGDAAQLTLEQALRDRFAFQYQGQIVQVRDKDNREYQITMTSYIDFFEHLRKIRGPRIRMGPSREWKVFNGTLGGLLTWARREGLLRGQRNRSLDPIRQALRNTVAHGVYHLDSPVEAARSLCDLAETINQLWGHPTPGGRLYPAPLSRSIVAIGWNDNGENIRAGYADSLVDAADEDEFTYILIRAVFCPGGVTDPRLLGFDARSATTTFPAQYLWGPGSRQEAIAWLRDHHPEPDVCDHLDQVVLARVHDGQVEMPMYPGIAAGLPAAEQRDGTWYALRVDHGLDALAHIRAAVGGVAEHDSQGECGACPVETLATGNLTAVLEAARDAGTDTTPLRVPDVSTPLTHRMDRPAPLAG
ncbi:hypothetical protein [Actinoallomurus sp. NPDC050550]|uniref:hypothetical protein n=1 Tax=Actinoallomurus sp. NPDC050550 TaxID=3154937 RepID=UPI0033DD4987